MSAPSSPSLLPGAVVIDASVVIAICAKEAGREPMALAELSLYSSQGYEFYAPGVMASEALYVLCGKEQDGTLTPTDYRQAILELEREHWLSVLRKSETVMGAVAPPTVST